MSCSGPRASLQLKSGPISRWNKGFTTNQLKATLATNLLDTIHCRVELETKAVKDCYTGHKSSSSFLPDFCFINGVVCSWLNLILPNGGKPSVDIQTEVEKGSLNIFSRWI